jgi:hypothetical protein
MLATPGDYLVEHHRGKWRVLLVRDVVALRRLEPLTNALDVGDFVEEPVDSRTPAYDGHVYALSVPVEGEFGTREEALRAIRDRSVAPVSEARPLLVRIDDVEGDVAVYRRGE